MTPVIAPDGYDVACPLCGGYRIMYQASHDAKKHEGDPRLLRFARQASEFGRELTISTEDIDRVVALPVTYSFAEKRRSLLRWLAMRSEYAGHELLVDVETDWPAMDVSNARELKFVIRAAADEGYIREGGDTEFVAKCIVAAKGWAELDDVSGEVVSQDRAFVAMSFSDAMRPAYEEGIRVGAAAAGYRAIRVDSDPHIERIDLRIIGDIRSSLFVIADCTEQKNGVYFEAGYALALRKPVIWTVSEDELKHVHFDTRQFCYIVWKDYADLATKLEGVIAGVVGRKSAIKL